MLLNDTFENQQLFKHKQSIFHAHYLGNSAAAAYKDWWFEEIIDTLFWKRAGNHKSLCYYKTQNGFQK